MFESKTRPFIEFKIVRIDPLLVACHYFNTFPSMTLSRICGIKSSVFARCREGDGFDARP